MAGRITLWGAGQLLSSFFSQGTQPPQDFYLAMIRSIAPTAYVSGSELDEPDAESYERVKIPNTTSYWGNQGQLQVSVLERAVVFVTAQEDWGELRHWALCNAPTGGYAYFVGNLEAPVTISTGDALSVLEGDLSVTTGPFYTSEESG